MPGVAVGARRPPRLPLRRLYHVVAKRAPAIVGDRCGDADMFTNVMSMPALKPPPPFRRCVQKVYPRRGKECGMQAARCGAR